MKKTYNLFRPMILSRHPSHQCLRLKHKHIQPLPFRSVVRFGSTTEVEDTVARGGDRIEVNSIQSIKNSSSKLLMKQKFMDVGVKTAQWTKDPTEAINFGFPIVAKAHFGSKGNGNTLIKSQEEFDQWKANKNVNQYIFEKYMNYGHEFRLHITERGCFYTCRKALKKDTPQEEKWHFHDTTCTWFLEENELFFKPNSWNDIVNDCVKALKSIGADVLSFDVKVQTPTDKNGQLRNYQDYILLECNSASSMDNGTEELSVCAKKYIKEIPLIIINKANN